MRAAAPLLAAALVVPVLAWPAEPDELAAVPNRPTASTTAESIHAGVFEMEAGFEAASGHQNVNVLGKLGILDDLELWVGTNPLERDRIPDYVSGFGDTAAGGKWRFVSQHGHVPSIGVLSLAKLPTAREELGTGQVDYAFTALVSKDFGHVHVDFNQGLELFGRGGGAGFDHDWFTALAASYSGGGPWSLSAEISGTTTSDGLGTTSLLGAVTYSPKPRLVWDTAVSVSVHGDQSNVTVVGGFTYTLGRLFRR